MCAEPRKAVLRDVTSGNNDVEGLLRGQYPAGKGWDACTGWGVPDGQKLLLAIKGGGSSKVASASRNGR